MSEDRLADIESWHHRGDYRHRVDAVKCDTCHLITELKAARAENERLKEKGFKEWTESERLAKATMKLEIENNTLKARIAELEAQHPPSLKPKAGNMTSSKKMVRND